MAETNTAMNGTKLMMEGGKILSGIGRGSSRYHCNRIWGVSGPNLNRYEMEQRTIIVECPPIQIVDR